MSSRERSRKTWIYTVGKRSVCGCLWQPCWRLWLSRSQGSLGSGPCWALTIQSKNIGRDITQGFKTLVGGELGAYTDMMNDARALATKRMVGEAEHLGADAVVNVRYASAAVMQGAAEVMAYGTAVKFK